MIKLAIRTLVLVFAFNLTSFGQKPDPNDRVLGVAPGNTITVPLVDVVIMKGPLPDKGFWVSSVRVEFGAPPVNKTNTVREAKPGPISRYVYVALSDADVVAHVLGPESMLRDSEKNTSTSDLLRKAIAATKKAALNHFKITE